MTLIKRVSHGDVEGGRFGKYNIADNSTALIYRIGNTVIDSGPPNQWAAVRGYLSEKRFEKVLLTHHHEDHSGNGARISRHFGVPVYIHSMGIEPIKKGFPVRLYQRIFWGRPTPFTPSPTPEWIETDSGHHLKPIHTPGHAPDHVCFLEPDKKWLFTGDLFLATRPKLFRADENLAREIESLKTILTYDFQTVFCAHKGVVPDGYSLLEKKLDYFTGLVHEVKAMHSEGRSVVEITHQLFGKKDSIGMISFKHICCENLIRECLLVDNDVV